MENIRSGGGEREIQCTNTHMHTHIGPREHTYYSLASHIYCLSQRKLRKKVRMSLYVNMVWMP